MELVRMAAVAQRPPQLCVLLMFAVLSFSFFATCNAHISYDRQTVLDIRQNSKSGPSQAHFTFL